MQLERPEISALLLKGDDKKVCFYTSLPNNNVFEPLIDFWSHYYSFITIAPNGSVVLISHASLVWPCIYLTKKSHKNVDFLKKFEYGDCVLTDRGFDVAA